MTTSNRRAFSPRRVLIVLLVAAGLIVSSCSDGGDTGQAGTSTDANDGGSEDGTSRPGVTDEEIAFAVVGTGEANPTGTCTLDCYVDGVEAYFAYRNSEGGVHGRNLTVTRVVDDELSKSESSVRDVLYANDTFGILAMPFLAGGFTDVAEAGVPLYTTIVTAQETAGQKSSFANGGVPCFRCPQHYPIYVATETDAKRVASIGYGESQASKDCVAGHRASFERFGAGRGIELVYSNDELPYGRPNGFTAEVAEMKAAEVDLVLTCLDQNAVRALEAKLEEQAIGDVPVLLSGDGYGSPDFFAGSEGIFEGDFMLTTFRPFESDIAGTGTEKFLQWLKETGNEDTDVSNAMFGWLNADLAYRGIEGAGPGFDRESVITATNALADYTADGVVAPVDWSRQHEPPTVEDAVTHGPDPVCVSFLRVVDDAFELVGDRAAPWMCWDPAAPEYTEPRPMNFT